MSWENLSGEKQREVISQQGLNDLYFFNKVILGFGSMTEGSHLELCNFVSRPYKRKKLILMPRGSYKSSIITIGMSLWEIARNPNTRILIDSETNKNSKAFLRKIKSIIQENSAFRTLYGNLDAKKEAWKWTDSEIIVATRTDHHKEATIETAGLDVPKVGMHFDKIIMDDCVSQNNITTKEQIEKVVEHYKYNLSILEPTGSLVIIGTRWHYLDLYGYLINESDTFDIFIKKALQADGSLFFPEVLSKDFLEEQRKAQGSSMFSCQYQNEPIDDETAVFKKKDIRYYTELPKLETLKITTTIDPAISIKETADFTAIVTVGVDSRGNIFVLETLQGRWNPNDIIERIYEVNERWCPSRIGIETVNFQQWIKFSIDTKRREGSSLLRITELKTPTNRTKDMRIRGLQPYFERGQVFIRRDMTALEYELLRFPKSENDDLIDALAYQLQIMGTGSLVRPPEDTKWRVTAEGQRQKALQKRLKSRKPILKIKRWG